MKKTKAERRELRKENRAKSYKISGRTLGSIYSQEVKKRAEKAKDTKN
jgi:hypothetical protein